MPETKSTCCYCGVGGSRVPELKRLSAQCITARKATAATGATASAAAPDFHAPFPAPRA